MGSHTVPMDPEALRYEAGIRGLTLEELARQAGIRRETIAELNRTGRCRLGTLQKIARILVCVPVDDNLRRLVKPPDGYGDSPAAIVPEPLEQAG